MESVRSHLRRYFYFIITGVSISIFFRLRTRSFVGQRHASFPPFHGDVILDLFGKRVCMRSGGSVKEFSCLIISNFLIKPKNQCQALFLSRMVGESLFNFIIDCDYLSPSYGKLFVSAVRQNEVYFCCSFQELPSEFSDVKRNLEI